MDEQQTQDLIKTLKWIGACILDCKDELAKISANLYVMRGGKLTRKSDGDRDKT